MRFLGFPVFEGLILCDLTRSDVLATLRPGLAGRWGQDKADPTAESVSVILFALIQLAPGDAASLLIPPGASKEVVDQIRAELGLEKPMDVQLPLARTARPWRPRILDGHQHAGRQRGNRNRQYERHSGGGRPSVAPSLVRVNLT